MLKTKSIQALVSRHDGLRVCVMRRPGEFTNWDIWVPKLAPSNELLNEYVYKGLSWEEMSTRYTKEVLSKQTKLISWLAKLSIDSNVTLLCFEESPANCHRKLLAQKCQKMMGGDFKVVLK